MITDNATTVRVSIRAMPWLGPSCTDNNRNTILVRHEPRSSEPVVGTEYDGWYNGTNALQNVTWEMIDGTMEGILAT